jgi:hypothetical protein
VHYQPSNARDTVFTTSQLLPHIRDVGDLRPGAIEFPTSPVDVDQSREPRILFGVLDVVKTAIKVP